jgi:hypothetical protein
MVLFMRMLANQAKLHLALVSLSQRMIVTAANEGAHLSAEMTPHPSRDG